MSQKIHMKNLDFHIIFEYNKLAIKGDEIMGDKLEKKLRDFLLYIIIIGATFMLLPLILILLNNKLVYNNIVLMGVFPLVTLGCSVYYAYKKKYDLGFAFIAPIVFIFTMFLYGIFTASPINSIIYLVAYFICGFIGLTVGDMLRKKDNKTIEDDDDDDLGYVRHRKRNVPKVVATQSHVEHVEDTVEDIEMPQHFEEHHHEVEAVPSYDDDYDLDAILAEIHNRRH